MLSDFTRADLKVLECALVTYQGELDIQLLFKVPGTEDSILRTDNLIRAVQAELEKRSSQELQGM